MSDYVWADCGCGVPIVSNTDEDDDIRMSVQRHNESVRHREWATGTELTYWRDAGRGPCICKGGEAGPRDPRKRAVA
jgi:hypothetical protein